MKFNKNVLLVTFISTTIGTLSYAMDGQGFTPVLSKKAQRRAKRAAAEKATPDAAKVVPDVSAPAQSALNGADKRGDTLNQLKGNLNKERGARNVPKLSWIAPLAGLIMVAEAVDFAYALCKTTKEELQDKTVAQTAQLIAQKTYTAALLKAAKNRLENQVIPGILDLKQKALAYYNKKKQTA